jgi:hypothetical protein
MLETALSYLTQPSTTHTVLDLLIMSANNALISVGTMETDVFHSIPCALELMSLMETVLLVILDIYYKEEDATWIPLCPLTLNQLIFFAEDGVLLVSVLNVPVMLS